MRVEIRPRAGPVVGGELVEIVTPRTNTASLTAAENFLAAAGTDEPFSLEIAATQALRVFLVRAGSASLRQRLEAQLGGAYPQAEMRPVVGAPPATLDPAWPRPDEQVAACRLALQEPPYLPLRTFRDLEVERPERGQADPLLGILAGLSDLPPDWRALAQVVLRPSPRGWSAPYRRLAVEKPQERERVTGQADTSLTSVFLLVVLMLLGGLAMQAYQWVHTHQWLRLVLLAIGLIGAAAAGLWGISHFGRRPVYDPQLVQEKISRRAYLAEIRLAVFAPLTVDPDAVAAHLARLASAYRQFDQAAGNSLAPQPLRLGDRGLRCLEPLGPRRAVPILNVRELAGLWHLPQAEADVPLVERTTARRHLPLPYTVQRGCSIGVSKRQGRSVPVALPDDLLRRHLLLVAKTRRGKSSLLLRLVQYLMSRPGGAGPRPSLVLVDPHHDLARAALGLVPPHRADDVVYLDAADPARPFGLNLLDTGLGWDRDKAVSNALTVFRREFEGFWGPRMEDTFRFALLTLYEANLAICQADPTGRGRQHTVLAVPALLTEDSFREAVVRLVTDPVVLAWWTSYYERLDRKLRGEIINPVQTKVQRYAGSLAARLIVGQPRSTVDPAAWLRSGAIVIVNTAKGTLGEDTAAVVGGTLVNLVALAVSEQARLEPAERRGVTLIVDEFHTMPGADYEAILSELAKYGANLILATQSLENLGALTPKGGRSLRSLVFANLDGLFAFQTSAEDAVYLAPELGGDLDVQDLVELGDYQCYARVSSGGERLPTFSVQLDQPPVSDPALQERLAQASAQRYGRERALVDRDIQAALTQVEAARQAKAEREQAAGRQAVLTDTKPVAMPALGASKAEPTSPASPTSQGKGNKKVRTRYKPNETAGGSKGASSGAALQEMRDNHPVETAPPVDDAPGAEEEDL